MNYNFSTVADITARLRAADADEFAVLERSLKADTRKSVVNALSTARRRLAAERAEQQRLRGMYSFQEELCNGAVCVGLDEVGRGPLAGPLAVGAVVLPANPQIEGLNDSKQVPAAKREQIAGRIKEIALAYSVQYIAPEEIDAAGMTASLRVAFMRAIKAIEDAGVVPEVVLLDGNAMHLDPREKNVIKGDGKCASIAAASIVAKVARDSLMDHYAEQYPQYGFEHNKGYASADHQQAIRDFGLTPIHRASFCTAFTQDTLF